MKKKKFEFESTTKKATIIDCLECENYYTGACDGRAGGCDDYTPTRKITMEKDIREIKAFCRSNWILNLGFAVAFIILCIGAVVSTL